MNKEFEDLLTKVSVLYRKYGIKSVTMDDVAHELGISKKTLYQFVCDKTELVQKVVEHVRQCNFSSMRKEGRDRPECHRGVDRGKPACKHRHEGS